MATQKTTKRVDDLLSVDHFDEKARQALLKLGSAAHELLQDYATGSHPSGNPDFQGRAILTLGDSKEAASAVPALRTAVLGLDPAMRIRAMRSLGRLGGAEATEILREALQRPDVEDVETTHGIRALAMVETPAAREALESVNIGKLAKPVAQELSDALEGLSD